MPSLSCTHTTLRQIWGEDVCSNILFVLCIHPFLHSSQSTCAVDKHNGNLDERVLEDINGTLVFTQDKSEQTCIVSGDRKPPQVCLRSRCEQQEGGCLPERDIF